MIRLLKHERVKTTLDGKTCSDIVLDINGDLELAHVYEINGEFN